MTAEEKNVRAAILEVDGVISALCGALRALGETEETLKSELREAWTDASSRRAGFCVELARCEREARVNDAHRALALYQSFKRCCEPALGPEEAPYW